MVASVPPPKTRMSRKVVYALSIAAVVAVCLTIGALVGSHATTPAAPAATAAPTPPTEVTQAYLINKAAGLVHTETGFSFNVTTYPDLPFNLQQEVNDTRNINLGLTICNAMTNGQMTPQSELNNLVNNGFTYDGATHYMHMTATYLCPAWTTALPF
jgi:hypothetical protein